MFGEFEAVRERLCLRSREVYPANGPWVLLFCLIDMRRVRRNDHELPKSNFVSCIVYLDRASTTQAIDHHCGGNALSAFDVVMGS